MSGVWLRFTSKFSQW